MLQIYYFIWCRKWQDARLEREQEEKRKAEEENGPDYHLTYTHLRKMQIKDILMGHRVTRNVWTMGISSKQ